MYCSNAPLSTIAKVFEQKRNDDTIPIGYFQLLVQPNDLIISANLLTNHRVEFQIGIYCQALGTQRIMIDPDAFYKSRNFTFSVEISFCDLTGTSFDFLRGFVALKHLSLDSGANVHLANWTTFPILPQLDHLKIIYCTGLMGTSFYDFQSAFTPGKKGFSDIQLQGNEIGDEAMDRILQRVLKSSAKSLYNLNIGNNHLTRIPSSVKSFQGLRLITLDNNLIKAIHSAAFPNSSSASLGLWLSFKSCGIQVIDPAAFKGFHFFFQDLSLYILT